MGPEAETETVIESQLEEDLKKLSSIEEKLQLAIGKMEEALKSEKSPLFKLFWEAKQQALLLFKESLHPLSRSKFWDQFVEASNEAKRLKAILDEQAAFNMEQIELAISGLQKDIENSEALLLQMAEVKLPNPSLVLERKKAFYAKMQKELDLLNTFASRVNSLRKEVLKTEMRIKFKSRFFKQLSSVGDLIFPKRKELIRELSEKFVADVEYFCQNYFQEEDQRAPFYLLKEEIKKLQGVSKVFTLNTKAFTQARLKLSESWDKLKSLELKHKTEMEQKKTLFEENVGKVREKITALEQKCREGLEERQAERESGEILKFMRTVELSSPDVRFLKEELEKALRPLREKEKQEEARAKEL
ncbi:MAG: hypothetical protein WC371_05600, partial [Parachlamydiales bacterium]